jgi:sugar fermentation stimulation protein A
MRFNPPLQPGRILRRYRRFLADVELPDGRQVTAHCPNPGRMQACWAPGWEVRLSDHADAAGGLPAGRRLRWTRELGHNGRCWIGVNTLLTNRIAAEAITAGRIPELAGFDRLLPEQRCGRHHRLDFIGETPGGRCYLEVKSVTLVDPDGRYRFPDAVTTRGTSHCRLLARRRRQGDRAALLFVIQRSDGSSFSPAPTVDPEYARALRAAWRAGVEVLPYLADVDPAGIELTARQAPLRWD